MGLLGQLLINGVYVGCIYALLGLSFATIFATTKIWHFAQGAVYTVGAYAVLVAVSHYGWPMWFAAPIGVAAAGALGAFCLVAIYRPLGRLKATPLVMVMASLGFMIVVDNILVLVFGPTGHSIDVKLPPPFEVAGLQVSGAQFAAPLCAAAVVALYLAFLFGTNWGRQMRALVDNEELLLINGVETQRLKLVAFALGSALLPVAALLFAFSGAGISPYIGVPAVLTGAMAMFFGGVDSIGGAALAGFLIGVLESLAAFVLPTEWQTAVTYALILVFLMLRPTGLLGRALPRSAL